ncbi:MAG: ABC transporter substrate-binding protein [Candidatus Nanopelagicales bacterium]
MKSFGLVAAGVSLALALAACGSPTAANGPSASPTPTPIPSHTCAPVPGITNTSIKLGLVFPQTGPAAATFANFDVAAQLRVDEINRKGGLDGRQVSLRIYDDRNDSPTQAKVAKQAVDDGVFGIIAASQQQAMYPLLNQLNVPVTGIPNLPPYATNLNVFGAYGAFSTTYASTAAAQRFFKGKARSVAIVSLKSPGALAASRGFAATLRALKMKQALPLQVVASGSAGTAAIATKIRKSKATGVNVVSLVESGVSLMKSLRQQRVSPAMVLIAGLTDPKDVTQSQGALDGVVGAPYGFIPLQVDHPEIKTYVAGMAAKEVNPYSDFAPLGYVAADLMLDGIGRTGSCPTREDFIRILRGVTDYLGAGLLPGKVSFTPGVTPDGDPQKCSWFLTVRGETMLPDTNATCGVLVKVDE